MSELKPCPFCGSEVQDDPHTGEKYPRKSPMGGWIIHCECCGASLSQFRKSGKGEISWNTRPIEDALNKRIAELEAHIAALKAKKRQQAVIASLIRVGDEMADKLNGLGITAFDHEWAKCKSWLEEGGEG